MGLSNGDRIKITGLPPCKNVSRNTPNPYIGMRGEVIDFDGEYFNLHTGNSVLCAIRVKKCKYIKI